jgi:SAM-dependent methyltransferase
MSQVPTSEKIYYKEKYWNEHKLVLEYHSKILTSFIDKDVFWIEYIKKTYFYANPAKKALFINCGNGWAERDFYKLGIFESCDCFDYSEELLSQARIEAKELPFNYFQTDCNKIEIKPNSYDLIVNVAAMHHVQYIERLNQILAKSLKEDGLYINYDYIGPHRNQYSTEHWNLIKKINDFIPFGLRNENLNKPHLQTMLVDDPTEAIHSELILDNFYRYFNCIERKDLNGGIAYQIMFNNNELYTNTSESDFWVNKLIELDELATNLNLVPPLFSFFIGYPNKKILLNNDFINSRLLLEEQSEKKAAENNGIYL